MVQDLFQDLFQVLVDTHMVEIMEARFFHFLCNFYVEFLCLYRLSCGVGPYGVGTGTLPGAKPLKPPGTACE